MVIGLYNAMQSCNAVSFDVSELLVSIFHEAHLLCIETVHGCSQRWFSAYFGLRP